MAGDTAQKIRLTDNVVKALEAPATGQKIVGDGGGVSGFGLRITAGGAKAFVLSYRTKAGRSRRITIGQWPTWRASQAREEAQRLKRDVDLGGDPLGDLEELRAAPTVADLCARYEKEHLPSKRRLSVEGDKAQIRNYLLGEGIKKVEGLPKLKHQKVADIGFSDVSALHRAITEARGPYAANRTIAMLSKMFNLAVRWGWRTDNPCRGIKKNAEDKRERYMSDDERARLLAALPAIDAQAAAVVRLLILTGARKGEVFGMRWCDLDLERGTWTKPASATKQGRLHRIPLSPEAVTLLRDLHAVRGNSAHVFPDRSARPVNGSVPDLPIKGIKRQWEALLRTAEIKDLRVHDLRHSFASVLVNEGLSLPVIGALLGHSAVQTTARYAHLADDALRAAASRVGRVVSASESPEPEGQAKPKAAEPAA